MFRLAQMSDLAEVTACVLAAYETEAEAIGVRLAPLDTDYAAAIGRAEVYLSVTPEAGLEGLVLFRAEPPVMYLDNVAVPTACQGKGIGGKLIAYCEDTARDLGCTSVELYTNQKLLRNIEIYRHLGYEVTDRRLDEGFHRIFFRKWLSKG